MRGLDRLESLNEGFYGDDSSTASFFPALEKLEINEMSGLKTWCFPGGDRHRAFASLKELQINSCRQLIKIPFCFPCLAMLGIQKCDNLIEIEMFGGEEESVSATYEHSLRSIQVCDCPKLEEIPNNFVKLKDVNCMLCKKLVSVPRLQHVQNLSLAGVSESFSLKAGIQDSTYLEELYITNYCRNVAVQVLSVDLNHLASLTCLYLDFGDDDYERIGWESDDQMAKRPPPFSRVCGFLAVIFTLEAGRLPESIEELAIWDFPHLESLSGLLPTLKNLRRLHVYECPLVNQKPGLRMHKLIPQQFKTWACNFDSQESSNFD